MRQKVNEMSHYSLFIYILGYTHNKLDKDEKDHKKSRGPKIYNEFFKSM